MSFLERDLHFCEECLQINGLGSYNKTVLTNKYKEVSNKLQKLREIGQDIRIENLCISGGGIKTSSYIGALQVLDDFQLLDNIKRIACSSGGTTIALLMAFKYSINEIRDILFQDQSKYLDRSLLSFTGLISACKGNYGMHSGKLLENDVRRMINESFDKYFPDLRAQKGTNYDPTFLDVYELFGIELIITGTNLNKKRPEYFCPRLTPDMPIYIAARISMSYPLLYEFVDYNGSSYMDSVCSYPLHIFYDCAEDILFNPQNVFDYTLGFNNYSVETNNEVITNEKWTSNNYIIDLIENNNNLPVKSFMDYIFAIIKSAQHFIEKSEMRAISSIDKNNYFNHTICTILKHFDLFNLSPNEIQRSDATTLYKIKMIEWIDSKIDSINSITA